MTIILSISYVLSIKDIQCQILKSLRLSYMNVAGELSFHLVHWLIDTILPRSTLRNSVEKVVQKNLSLSRK